MKKNEFIIEYINAAQSEITVFVCRIQGVLDKLKKDIERVNDETKKGD